MADVTSFIQQIAPAAVQDCVNTGVYPSLVIAMAIQESGAGTSKLARFFNNLFGHVASATWSGKKGKTAPNGRLWRIYDSMADSISAHIQVLKRPLYRMAGAFTAKTPFEQALALQKAGYNAGPDRAQYAAKLYRIIKSYGLQRYDQQMQAIERSKNTNGLAYHEQSGTTLTLHQIFG